MTTVWKARKTKTKRPRVIVTNHGITGSPWTLRGVNMQLLGDHEDIVIVSPYLPNHGLSSDISTFYGMVNMSAEWADTEEITDEILVGWSLGAAAALGLAHKRAGRTKGVVAISPPFGPEFDIRPYPAQRFNAKMALVALDMAATASVALLISWLMGDFMLGSDLLRTARDGFRWENCRQVLLTAPNTENLMNEVAAQGTPLVCHGRGLDLIAQPRNQRGLPGEYVMERFLTHNAPLMSWTSRKISDTVGRLLGDAPPLSILSSALPAA